MTIKNIINEFKMWIFQKQRAAEKKTIKKFETE